MERNQRLIELVKERRRKREAELLIKALPPEFIQQLKDEVKEEVKKEFMKELAKVTAKMRVGGGGLPDHQHPFSAVTGVIDDAQATQFLLLDGSRKMTGTATFQHLIPDGSNTYQLGNASNRWKAVVSYQFIKWTLIEAGGNASFKTAQDRYVQFISKLAAGDQVVGKIHSGYWDISRAGDITGLAGKTLDFPTVNVDTLGDSGATYVNMASDLVVPATKGLDVYNAEYFTLPSSAPSSPTTCDCYVDTANSKLCVRIGGAWKCTALT